MQLMMQPELPGHLFKACVDPFCKGQHRESVSQLGCQVQTCHGRPNHGDTDALTTGRQASISGAIDQNGIFTILFSSNCSLHCTWDRKGIFISAVDRGRRTRHVFITDLGLRPSQSKCPGRLLIHTVDHIQRRFNCINQVYFHVWPQLFTNQSNQWPVMQPGIVTLSGTGCAWKYQVNHTPPLQSGWKKFLVGY
jgi:hypothetical protein